MTGIGKLIGYFIPIARRANRMTSEILRPIMCVCKNRMKETFCPDSAHAHTNSSPSGRGSSAHRCGASYSLLAELRYGCTDQTRMTSSSVRWTIANKETLLSRSRTDTRLLLDCPYTIQMLKSESSCLWPRFPQMFLPVAHCYTSHSLRGILNSSATRYTRHELEKLRGDSLI
jgi:hypothetical protein